MPFDATGSATGDIHAAPTKCELRLDLSNSAGEFVETLLVPEDAAMTLSSGVHVAARALRPGDRIAMGGGAEGRVVANTSRATSASQLSVNSLEGVAPRPSERVIGVSARQSLSSVRITVAGEVIDTTEAHRFFVAGRGWLPAVDLTPGMILDISDGDGRAPVDAVEQIPATAHTVFNLIVQRAHTFRVGRAGVLVHNGNGTCSLGVGRPNPTGLSNRALGSIRPSGIGGLRAPELAGRGRIGSGRLAVTARRREGETIADENVRIAAVSPSSRRELATRVTGSGIAPWAEEAGGVAPLGRYYYRPKNYTFVVHANSEEILVNREKYISDPYWGPKTYPESSRIKTLQERYASSSKRQVPPDVGGFRHLELIGQRDPGELSGGKGTGAYQTHSNYFLSGMNHRVLAKWMQVQGHKDENVLLLACRTGRDVCPESPTPPTANSVKHVTETFPIAQNLANKLGVKVTGPTTNLESNGFRGMKPMGDGHWRQFEVRRPNIDAPNTKDLARVQDRE